MSLRAFHLLFIGLSVVMCAFCAAWAVGEYRAEHHLGSLMAAIGSLVACGGLAAYGTAFQRKTRHL
jgi:hypothetical protein